MLLINLSAMSEFIQVKKFVRSRGSQEMKGELKISQEAIRIADIQTFRTWKPDSEEKALLNEANEQCEMVSVTIVNRIPRRKMTDINKAELIRDESIQEKVIESFDSFGKRVGMVTL